MNPVFTEGLAHYRAGRWFEAHEAWEEEWRRTPPGERRELLQALIQAAVALEHWRRGNPRGAWGQWRKARGRLASLPPVAEGFDLGALIADFEAYWRAVGLDAALTTQGWLPDPADPSRRVYHPSAGARVVPLTLGTPPTLKAAPVPNAAHDQGT